MAGIEDEYVEITTRLRAVRSFCDFLAHGGTVRVAAADASPFIDITEDLLRRKRDEAEKLASIRQQRFPEHAEEDAAPPLYDHH